MRPIPNLSGTIEEVSEQLGAGILTAVEVVERCLDRISRAWSQGPRLGSR